MEAGHYQSVLTSFVAKDEKLMARLSILYRADDGTPDSVFLGGALKSIITNDLESAKTLLRRKQPRFESQFVGYAECLDAIVDKDTDRFIASLGLAAKSWRKFAARHRSLPDAVCFIQGAGLVCLAERICGSRMPISFESIPAQLL